MVLAELQRRACSLCEIGVPYSDPIADGKVIQASYTRALESEVTLADILAKIGQTAPQLSMPLVTMVSFAIVNRVGAEEYINAAKASGITGVTIPDLPVEESEALAEFCANADFSLIQLVAPTTPRERAIRIAKTSSGFLYYISVTGITGERQELPRELLDNVRWLKTQTDLPICIGFGISRPEHIRRLVPVADGLIVGSAIVRRIAEAETRPRLEVIKEVGDYVAGLVEAIGMGGG